MSDDKKGEMQRHMTAALTMACADLDRELEIIVRPDPAAWAPFRDGFVHALATLRKFQHGVATGEYHAETVLWAYELLMREVTTTQHSHFGPPSCTCLIKGGHDPGCPRHGIT